VRYCEYAVNEEKGGQYPGGEYDGEQDAYDTDEGDGGHDPGSNYDSE